MSLDSSIDRLNINLHLTRQCNYSCKHCMYASGPQLSPEYMTYDVIRCLRSWFMNGRDSWGTKFDNISINLVGGEPTLDLNKFETLFSQVYDLCYSGSLSLEMTTNGWWLEDYKNALTFFRITRNALEEYDSYFRISNSEWHKQFRSSRLQSMLDYASKHGSVQCLFECAYAWWSEDELDTVYAIDAQSDALDHVHVESINKGVPDLYAKLSATGRGRKLGGYHEPTCHFSGKIYELMLTVLPNGDVRDFCCNGGGLVRLGKLWDRSFNEWMSLAHSYISKVVKVDSTCIECNQLTSEWRKQFLINEEKTQTCNSVRHSRTRKSRKACSSNVL